MPLPEDCLFYGFKETMTPDQDEFVNAVIDYNMVLSNSPAGSGKTTMAFAALNYLRELGVIDHIYYLFSPVEEGKMGFRPGDQKAKEWDYTGPLDDAIVALGYQPMKVRTLVDDDMKFQKTQQGFVTAMSHIFLRGRTFSRVGVILDEGQNWTRGEFKKALSRFSEDCHIVVTGHTGQIDIKEKDSYFEAVIEHYLKAVDKNGKPRAKSVTLTKKNFRGWISEHADLL